MFLKPCHGPVFHLDRKRREGLTFWVKTPLQGQIKALFTHLHLPVPLSIWSGIVSLTLKWREWKIVDDVAQWFPITKRWESLLVSHLSLLTGRRLRSLVEEGPFLHWLPHSLPSFESFSFSLQINASAYMSLHSLVSGLKGAYSLISPCRAY